MTVEKKGSWSLPMPDISPPSEVPRESRTFRLRGLHIAVIVAIATSALIQLVRGLYPLLAEAGHPDALVDDRVYQMLTSASQYLLYAAGILFVTWLWRARKNLDSLGGSTTAFGAGWAIGGWFIPIANLFIPHRLLLQVTRDSSTSKTTIRLVHVWWAAYLSQVVGLLAVAMTDDWIPIAALAALFWGVAGCSLAVIVRAVTGAQHSRMDALDPSLGRVAANS